MLAAVVAVLNFNINGISIISRFTINKLNMYKIKDSKIAYYKLGNECQVFKAI